MNRINKFLLILTGILIFQQVRSQDILTLSGALEKALENNYGLIISRASNEIAGINNNPDATQALVLTPPIPTFMI